MLTKRDPEQEVQDIALPGLDAVIKTVRTVLPDAPETVLVKRQGRPERRQQSDATTDSADDMTST